MFGNDWDNVNKSLKNSWNIYDGEQVDNILRKLFFRLNKIYLMLLYILHLKMLRLLY